MLHDYPVTMVWFSDGLAVVAAAPEYQEILGARVIRIGSMTPAQAESAVTPYIAHENAAHLLAESPRYFATVELMQHEKIADADGHLQLTCAKVAGQEFTIDLAPPGAGKAKRKLVAALDVLPIPTTLRYKHRKAFYWQEYLADRQTLYIQLNNCHEQPGHPFKDFDQDLFAFADSHPVRRVILDLRSNKGGDPKMTNPLEDDFLARPALTARGHLYVLVDRSTFSAAMDEAAYFRKHFQAILVGEPPGNKPNHYGNAESFKLPNSKLEVEYSTRYVRKIRDADPLTLAPDIVVPYTLNDFLAGCDSVLETALHHPVQ
jgi:C-terminal processing protease CtpA/Prc